jgi:uncharacterized membrane protein YvbJ
MEDEDVFCERCGKKFPIEKKKETEVKKEGEESKFSFTPMEVLEIFIAFVAPLGIFIYITRFTESPRYV